MRAPPWIDRERFLAVVIAVAAGIAVFWIASAVFPYHSSNHDEGVYLQQAAMLLDGQLQLHAGELTPVFRPWFFVEDGGRLYPKYAPVPAAMFAISMALFGEPRVTLAAVAAGNAALVYTLAAMLFDRRIGLVAAATFAAAPMALATTSVFLPYAPTTLLNLTFAVAYVRSVREERRDFALLAGAAIGTAFFGRPYTAVLFAAPFIGHALWTIRRSIPRDRPTGADSLSVPEPLVRNGLIAALGTLGVLITLAYNAHLTGSPLVFPYEAFAPRDGPGFGRREILGYSVEYTPELALRANGHALWYLATRWFTAGPIGTLFALVGATIAVRRWRSDAREETGLSVVLLLGLAISVIVGNVPFWGTHNALATLTDPTDGLAALFGPFYHFDLLVPLSVFAAVGVCVSATRVAAAIERGYDRWSEGRSDRAGDPASPRSRQVWALFLIVLAVTLPIVGVANAALVAAPLDRSATTTAKYEQAYEPFEDRSEDLGSALVFLPMPYGPWQNHPFQYLRNDPGFDGEIVYALDRSPASDFDVVAAYPERTYYRYTYRGVWSADPDRHVIPKLEPLTVRRGSELDAQTRVGVPDRVSRARVQLTTGGSDRVVHSVADPGETVTVDWTVDTDGARLRTVDGDPATNPETIDLDRTDELYLTVTLVQPDGSTLTYRQEATVQATDDDVAIIWPPERSVCVLVTDCGTEGTYLPDRPETHRDGVSFRTELTAE